LDFDFAFVAVAGMKELLLNVIQLGALVARFTRWILRQAVGSQLSAVGQNCGFGRMLFADSREPIADRPTEPLIWARNQAVGKGSLSNPRAKVNARRNLRCARKLRQQAANPIADRFCHPG
jgi:hypothetical protein